MSPLLLIVLSVVGAYLIGSIPWPYLVVRALRGVDIRTIGDGFMGTSNVWRAVGRKAAVAVFLGDMAKGALALLLTRWLGAPAYTEVLVGPAAVAGHIWPLFLRFRGGGGAAVAIGALWALLPREMMVLSPVGAVFLWNKRDTFFFNLVVLVGVVPLGLLFREPVVHLATAISIGATIACRQVWLHGPTMRSPDSLRQKS